MTTAWTVGALGNCGTGVRDEEAPHALQVIHAEPAAELRGQVGGQIPMVINSVPACMPHIEAKRLKVLGIASAARHPKLPDVQTFSESVPGVEGSAWYGVMAPAKTPAGLLQQLDAAIDKVLKLPEVQAKLGSSFVDPMPRGPQAFSKFLNEEIARWKSVVKQTGSRSVAETLSPWRRRRSAVFNVALIDSSIVNNARGQRKMAGLRRDGIFTIAATNCAVPAGAPVASSRGCRSQGKERQHVDAVPPPTGEQHRERAGRPAALFGATRLLVRLVPHRAMFRARS